MTKEEANIFIAGLNSDDSKTSQRPNTYVEGWNVSLVADDGGTNGALVTMKGNVADFTFPGLPQYTIGWGVIRDNLYMFTTTATGINDGTIWKVSYDETNGTSTVTSIFSDASLNFNKDFPIGEAIGVYETSVVQRLYWTDNNNVIRTINVVDPDISLLTVQDLALNSSAEMSIPRLTRISQSEGFLPVGSYYYTYRLRASDGDFTNWSPFLGPVNITKKTESASQSHLYEGTVTQIGPIQTSTKYVQLTIDNVDPVKYDIVELAYVYSNSAEITVSEIIKFKEISANKSTITVDHFGNEENFEELILEELITEQTFITRAKTLETKDSRLFAGNIQENSFEILDSEFDATVSRYTSAKKIITDSYGGNTCRNDNDDQYEYKYQSDGATLGAEGVNIKLEFDTDSIRVEGNSNGNSITPGGGRVSAYRVFPRNFWEDNNPINTNGTTVAPGKMSTPYMNPAKQLYMRGYQRGEFYRFGIMFYDTAGTSSFVKWIGDILTPEMYDETNGQDFHIVHTENAINNTAVADGRDKIVLVDSKPLNIKFDITIPNALVSKITAFSIVRVKRAPNDRRVIGQGVISPVRGPDSYGSVVQYSNPSDTAQFVNSDSSYRYYSPGRGLKASGAGIRSKASFQEWDGSSSIIPSNKAFTFESPDWQFKNQTFNDNDYIRVVACLKSNAYTESYLQEIGDDSSNSYGIGSIRYNNKLAPFNMYRSGTGPTSSMNNYIGGYNFQQGPDSAFNIIPLGDAEKAIRASWRTHVVNSNIDYINVHDDGMQHCTTLFCYIEPTVAVPLNLKWQDKTKFLGNYMRVRDNQYNGSSDEAISQNTYISCNSFVSINDMNSVTGGKNISHTVYGGDIFVNWYTFLKTYDFEPDPDAAASAGEATDRTPGFAVSTLFTIPIESTINTETRIRDLIRQYGVPRLSWQYNGTNDWNPVYLGETFLYNDLYSKVNDIKPYYAKDFDLEVITSFDTKIYYTDKKVNGSKNDQWAVFKVDDAHELDNKYGPLNRLKVFKDYLYSFQDKGVSVVIVDPRAIAIDGDESSIVLGSGTAIDDVVYISTNSGSKHRWSIANSDDYLYYFDAHQKRIKAIKGREIIDLEGISGELRRFCKGSLLENDTPIEGVSVISAYDNRLKEMLFTIRHEKPSGFSYTPATDTNGFNPSDWQSDWVRTYVFNERAGVFTSNYSIDPHLYINLGHKLLYTMGNPFGATILRHGDGDPVSFNGRLFDANVSILSNTQPSNTKTFDNFNIMLEVESQDGSLPQDRFFAEIISQNDYQYSGIVDMVYGTNVTRRNREFSMAVPRNIVTEDWNTDNDITDPLYHDPSRLFKERMKDKYLRTKFIWKNNRKDKMILHYIKTFYRENIR
jgi:hypothetical protein